MSAPYRPVIIDDSAQLLAMSYRLRYQTFCLERLFFSKDEYPSQLESDSFDQASVHVGVLDADDGLVGTARVVPPNGAGLPLFRYCTLYPEQAAVMAPSNMVVEISRVVVNPRWRPRRTDDAAMDFGHNVAAVPSRLVETDRCSDDAFAALIKGLYQVTKRLHATHWIIAVEKPLRRRIARYGLPFHVAGPEVDYFGPVKPYVMSLADLDEVIRSRAYPVLESFPVGLEPEYWPTPLAQAGAQA